VRRRMGHAIKKMMIMIHGDIWVLDLVSWHMVEHDRSSILTTVTEIKNGILDYEIART